MTGTVYSWEHYATLRVNGNAAVVWRLIHRTEERQPFYLITLNGAGRRRFDHWSAATAYATHCLLATPPATAPRKVYHT